MSDTRDNQDRIGRRAHEIWEREGHPHGRHDEHWAQAQAEIQAEDASRQDGAPVAARASTAKGTRAAAEGLSAVESGAKPPKTAKKAAPESGKPSTATAKPARSPRKDGGKGAAPR